MGIYIRGMKMPTKEEIGKCIIVRHDGEILIVEFDNLVDGEHVACYPTNPMRAIPVPPHGRLGDLDAEETIVHCNNCKYGKYTGTEWFCDKHSGHADKFGEDASYQEYHGKYWFCADGEERKHE